MADRKTRGSAGAGRGAPPKPRVIDVGDRPAGGGSGAGDGGGDPDADPDAERPDHDGDDAELAATAGPLDVDPDAEADPDADVIDVDPDGASRAALDESAAEAVDDDDVERLAAAKPSGSLARRDPMAAYMREARRFPLLTPDEEHALAVRLVEHGDSRAARRLVEANLRLVVKIAYEYRRAHKHLLDLVQEGNIGLIQAVSKFDPYRGVKLSSYAAFWIRAYILKFVLNNWRLVKIGTTQAQRKLFFNLRKERERLEQLGFAPTTALLAEKLDVSEREVIEMERRLAAPEASLDAPVGGGADDDGTRTRLDLLPSDDARPDHAVAQSEVSDLVRSKLEAFAERLEGRELTIFRERMLTDEPLTLQELGDRYGVSRERARQLEKRLLERLKRYLEAELGSAIDIAAMTRD
jgi:RNA polymerase sigma-32 factor